MDATSRDPHTPPTPLGARTVAELCERLAELRAWAGNPSYAVITERVRQARAERGLPGAAQRLSRSTVFDLFRPDRNRLDVNLLVEVVGALGVDASGAASWRQAYGRATGSATGSRRPLLVTDAVPPPGEFVGREAAVHQLVDAPIGTTVLLVGMAGAGKSMLARQVAALRTDVATQRFVALGGGDRREVPIDGEGLVRELLAHVGVAPRTLRQLDVDAMRQLWASWIDEHTPLIVLDDAVDAAQVEAAVPARHRGLIIVTSRTWIELPGARVLAVDPLTDDEAVAFLHASLHDGLSGRPSSAAALPRIADLCGGLPLELALAAAKINEQPGWTLDDHLRRLERTAVGRSLSAALTATTESLDPALQLAFRRIALYPGSRVAAWGLSALCDTDRAEATRALGALRQLSLLGAPAGAHDDYLVHDLVREHAREVLVDGDPYSAQVDAVRRLCERAMLFAEWAAHAAVPVSSAPPGVDDESRDWADELAALEDADQARAWLHEHAPLLTALLELALSFELSEHAGRLAVPIVRYLDGAGDWDLAVATIRRVLATPDPEVRAGAHRRLALLLIRQHRYDEAIEALGEALAVPTDDDVARELGHTLLGGAYAGVGRLTDAVEQHRIAAALARESGDPVRIGRALGNLGNRMREVGELAEAERLLAAALPYSVEAGDEHSYMLRLGNLGLLYVDMGRDDEAEAALREALRRGEQFGTKMMEPRINIVIGEIHVRRGEVDRGVELIEAGIAQAEAIHADAERAEGLRALGDVEARRGRFAAARSHYEAALVAARERHDRLAEIEALNGLGSAQCPDDAASARTTHSEALALAERAGYRIEIARAQRGLAAAAHALGDEETARGHQAIADRLFAETGAPG